MENPPTPPNRSKKGEKKLKNRIKVAKKHKHPGFELGLLRFLTLTDGWTLHTFLTKKSPKKSPEKALKKPWKKPDFRVFGSFSEKALFKMLSLPQITFWERLGVDR